MLCRIPSFVERIYVVDDRCPESSGDLVRNSSSDPRVTVIYNEKNLGVGGAMLAGYGQALRDGIDIVVKIDGDGQMDPDKISQFIAPIVSGNADYTKGNRFYSIDSLVQMPFIRKVGNAGLSFVNKLTSGYWNIMDPTNGYTAIHREALSRLPFSKISQRYFFESDMLFRLSTIRAVVVDISMDALYDDEESNLSVMNSLISFPGKYFSRLLKRIFYNYFLRDFNAGSMNLSFAVILLLFGILYGGYHWILSLISGENAASGIIMLAALPIILGYQSLLMFLQHDVNNIPKEVIHKRGIK